MPASAYPILTAVLLILLLTAVAAIVYRSWRNGISPMPASASVRQAVVRELRELERAAALEREAPRVPISPSWKRGRAGEHWLWPWLRPIRAGVSSGSRTRWFPGCFHVSYCGGALILKCSFCGEIYTHFLTRRQVRWFVTCTPERCSGWIPCFGRA